MKSPEDMVKFLTAGHATGYGAIDAAIERGDVRMKDVRELMVAAIDGWREQEHIEVQLWRAEHDHVRVVQIDTKEDSGRLRINLNDAPIWDGDPEVGSTHHHAIEILHSRDPDSSCEHTVFVNGQPTTAYTMESIDPGAGYEREDWDERFDLPDHYSPAFRQATLETLEAYGDSPYIEDHREHDLQDPDERED